MSSPLFLSGEQGELLRQVMELMRSPKLNLSDVVVPVVQLPVRLRFYEFSVPVVGDGIALQDVPLKTGERLIGVSAAIDAGTVGELSVITVCPYEAVSKPFVVPTSFVNSLDDAGNQALCWLDHAAQFRGRLFVGLAIINFMGAGNATMRCLVAY